MSPKSTLSLLFLGLACLLSGTSLGYAHGLGGGGDFNRSGSGPNPNDAYREGLEYLDDGECRKADRRFKVVLKAAAKYFRRAIKYDKSMYAAYEHLGKTILNWVDPTKLKNNSIH